MILVITLLQNAIGNKNKRIRVLSDEDSDDIEMITIDSLNLIGCDFIKIGMGGAPTRLVVLGAINTIKRFNPAILYQQSQEINDILEPTGYRFVNNNGTGIEKSTFL